MLNNFLPRSLKLVYPMIAVAAEPIIDKKKKKIAYFRYFFFGPGRSGQIHQLVGFVVLLVLVLRLGDGLQTQVNAFDVRGLDGRRGRERRRAGG